MKIFTSNILKLVLTTVFILVITVGCKDDYEPYAHVTFTETTTDIENTRTDIGGDIVGDGGSTTEVYTWNNSLSTVDFNMDITAAKGGSFNLTIQDAEGVEVLNETLVVGQGDDSRSGVSAAGTPGEWTVTITLIDFNGDGSFSISPGN
ncbi:hypothetical protein OO013_09535 [Mangrovivirga sp. M17]|uniref:Uncharacterized protein n=1 Tax=Mangrovivirga halotolerans TaxID=2993936 RepID=A0ABT3RQP5_9BACT|nr:hypothetical protein [Mangrovivirga halotolerans]MCX2744107.1 hypothetical protein [Mangrovivirga halotolerans]